MYRGEGGEDAGGWGVKRRMEGQDDGGGGEISWWGME